MRAGLRIDARVFSRTCSLPATVAALAADIPLGDGFGFDVVVDGVTAVAERPRRALGVFGRIEGGPPIRAFRHAVGAPNLVHHVPLCGEREVIVADLLEVTLLPVAAIDKGDVVDREREQRMRHRQIGNDRVGMLLRIAHDIGHPRLTPAVIDFLMALAARGGAAVVCRRYRRGGIGRFRNDRRDLGQTADIGDELPEFAIGHVPCGHPRVPDAVADMIKNLAVSERGRRRAERGRPRILSLPHLGPAAAVVGVTGLAFLPELFTARRDGCRIGIVTERIDGGSRRDGNAFAQQPRRQHHFDPRRLVARDGQARKHELIERRGDREQESDTDRPGEPAFAKHSSSPSCAPSSHRACG